LFAHPLLSTSIVVLPLLFSTTIVFYQVPTSLLALHSTIELFSGGKKVETMGGSIKSLTLFRGRCMHHHHVRALNVLLSNITFSRVLVAQHPEHRACFSTVKDRRSPTVHLRRIGRLNNSHNSDDDNNDNDNDDDNDDGGRYVYVTPTAKRAHDILKYNGTNGNDNTLASELRLMRMVDLVDLVDLSEGNIKDTSRPTMVQLFKGETVVVHERGADRGATVVKRSKPGNETALPIKVEAAANTLTPQPPLPTTATDSPAAPTAGKTAAKKPGSSNKNIRFLLLDVAYYRRHKQHVGLKHHFIASMDRVLVEEVTEVEADEEVEEAKEAKEAKGEVKEQDQESKTTTTTKTKTKKILLGLWDSAHSREMLNHLDAVAGESGAAALFRLFDYNDAYQVSSEGGGKGGEEEEKELMVKLNEISLLDLEDDDIALQKSQIVSDALYPVLDGMVGVVVGWWWWF